MLTRRGILGAAGVFVAPTQASVDFDPGPICSASPRLSPRLAQAAEARGGPDAAPVAADHRLDIRVTALDLGDGVAVSTKTYNGQFPGPLMRAREGEPFTVEVHNHTDTPEQVHWHGLTLAADVDGAAEEGTPFIPPGGSRRMTIDPRPSGLRFYHSHLTAGADLSQGLYGAQAGVLMIDPRDDDGRRDREVFLVLKEFAPIFSTAPMDVDPLAPRPRDRRLHDLDQTAVSAARAAGRSEGFQVAHGHHAINGRKLGAGEPIRVKTGERVLFHIVNASATDIRGLALPGHLFNVVALDGNRAPRPAPTTTIWLAPAERVSAWVDMSQPGVWILGDVAAEAREKGMGVVVEYAGASGKPVWRQPPRATWDYGLFADPAREPAPPDETIDLLIQTRYGARDGFDEFTINGEAFSMETMRPRFRLAFGRRYRLHVRNATDDVHPLHLHRHGFEITSIGGQPLAGLIKDVVMVAGFQEMTLDFLADQRGPSLFHCHMQHHMDFGFMALFDCA